MHPVHSGRLQLDQSYPQQISSHNTIGGLIHRWLGPSIRKWQRRKMIAALNALDTRTLRDIGIDRCDIEHVVNGFDEHELQMVPLAPPHQSAHFDQPARRAA